MTTTTTRRIAELNDLCRTAMGVAGKLFQTCGIDALPAADQSAIREKVERFDAFTPDNDPHGERDFGAFEHEDQRSCPEPWCRNGFAEQRWLPGQTARAGS